MTYIYALIMIAIFQYLTSVLSKRILEEAEAERVREAEVALLRENYQAGAQRIKDVDSVCLESSIEDVFRQLALDDPEHSSYEDLLNGAQKVDFANGMLLTDLSGIAHYALGPLLAARWAEKSLFAHYDLVLLLPIENIYSLCAGQQPGLDVLAKAWGINRSVDPDRTLVIVTGHPDDQIKHDDLQLRQDWLQAIQNGGVGRLYISNREIPRAHIAHEYRLSLKPFYLTVHHCAKDSPWHSAFSISGADLMQEALQAQEQTLYKEDEVGSITTSEGWHAAILRMGSKDRFSGRGVHTPQIYPSLTFGQVMGRIGRGVGSVEEEEGAGVVREEGALQTTADWFSVAAAYAASPGKPFGAYRLGSALIVRRFFDHYVRAIDAASQALLPPFPSNPGALTLILNVVTTFTAAVECGLKSGTVEDLNSALEEKTKELEDELRPAQWRELRGRKLPAISEARVFFDLLKKNPKIILKFGYLFSKGESDKTAYRGLQVVINRLIEEEFFGPSITSDIREVLSGGSDDVSVDLVTALAATFISEPARYPLSFIAALFALDLFQSDPSKEVRYWQRAFCHPNHHGARDNIWDAIIVDFSHILGGILPMTHGNSYHQASSENRPQYGLDWVDFKIHLLTIRWLSQQMEKDQAFRPNLSGELSLTPPKEHPVLTNTAADPIRAGRVIAYPFAFDRFSRRVETFSMMLNPTQPIRNHLSLGIRPDRLGFSLVGLIELRSVCRLGLPRIGVEDSRQQGVISYPGMLREALSDFSLNPNGLFGELRTGVTWPAGEKPPLDRREISLDAAIAIDPEFWQLKLAYASILVVNLGRSQKAAELIQLVIAHAESDEVVKAAAGVKKMFSDLYQREIARLQEIKPADRTSEQWGCFLDILQVFDIYGHPIEDYLDDCKSYLGLQRLPEVLSPDASQESLDDHRTAFRLLKKYRPDLERNGRTNILYVSRVREGGGVRVTLSTKPPQ